MSWTLTISGAATAKAGVNVNSTLLGDATTMNRMSDDVEGRIELETNTAWVANHTGLSTPIKSALSGLASSLIANEMIGYDMSGYLGQEARTMLDLNDNTANRLIKDLEGKSDKLKTP